MPTEVAIQERQRSMVLKFDDSSLPFFLFSQTPSHTIAKGKYKKQHSQISRLLLIGYEPIVAEGMEKHTLRGYFSAGV